MAPIRKVGIPAHLKCCVAAPKTTENLSAQDEIGAGGYSRELWVNEPERSAASKYPLNRTSTTKYSLLTFFPKGLYEQFRRLANLYFLFSAAISLTPLTPYSPVTVILPLIFVIGVSLIKEAIEDWRRHGADVEINNRKVLRHGGAGQLESVRWRDLRVGDVVKVEKDAFFPADLLFLASSSEEASCYVETMNLDGETNLKVRRALEPTLGVHNDLASFKDAHLKCEDPNPSLYTFVGTLEWGGQTLSIPASGILLRDSKLRNTEWVVGGVIFTGHDTKVMQNASDPPSKRSSLERQMDKIILALFAWLFVMAFVTGLVYGLLTKRAMPGAFYLGPFQHEVYWDPDRAAVGGILQFITAFILYGYLIPISLYVTVEIVKVIQAFNISQDRNMYYPETDQPTQCRTSNLNEELGQIDTILTDKTGTLTCNQMEFFKCSIAGVSYGTGQTEVEKAAIKRLKAEGRWHGDEEAGGAGDLSPTSSPRSNGAPSPTLPAGEIEAGAADAASDGRGNLPGAISSPRGAANGSAGAPRPVSPSSGTVGSPVRSPVRSPRAKRKGFNLVDERLQDGHWADEADPGTLRAFFRVLAVCHTAIPEGEPTRDKIAYQVESPDEGALVEAAAAFGFFFYRRTSSAVFVAEPAEGDDGKTVECKYDILNLLEFDSTRKRMSVIVKDPAGKILLLTKGADNVVLERLGPSGRQYAAATKEHLEQYSQAGLRTLCFASRVLDPAEYKAWAKTYDAAKAIVGPERGQRVDEAAEEIERDLTLLGCSGVEDKLQPGVPETIDKLAKAGLKIWVLTGDKVETAINIGYACSLLRQGMDRILVTLDRPEVAAADEAGDKDKLFEVSMRLTVEQLEGGLARIEALRQKEAEAPDAAPGVFALVIDGKSLTFALDAQNKDKFLKLAQACAAVIACRVSPKQKALVTFLVKEALGKICLGIGDGANDVGMINAADIGVGISGFEGTQAVMASDFAIGQFRFLERLLLVHGRWCYRRIALMISYFFYKNVTFGLTLFLFSRYAFFSVQPIYDDWYLTFYNLIFTSLPVIAVGVLDQDVGAETSLDFPALYLQGQANSYFSWSKISAWMLNGIYAALINYYLIIQGCTHGAFARGGRASGMYDVGTTMYTSILWTVTFQLSVAIGYWTWIHHLFVWGSMALWYLFCLAYGALPTSISPNVHKTFVERLAPAPAFWLLCLLVPTVAVLPDFTYRCGQRLLKPLDVHIVQEVEKSELFKRDPKAWQAMAAHAQKDTGVGFSRAVDDMVAGVTKLPKRVLGLVRKKKGARRRQPAAGTGLEMPPV